MVKPLQSRIAEALFRNQEPSVCDLSPFVSLLIIDRHIMPVIVDKVMMMIFCDQLKMT